MHTFETTNAPVPVVAYYRGHLVLFRRLQLPPCPQQFTDHVNLLPPSYANRLQRHFVHAATPSHGTTAPCVAMSSLRDTDHQRPCPEVTCLDHGQSCKSPQPTNVNCRFGSLRMVS